MADATRETVLLWMAAHNASPTDAGQHFDMPANRIKQWAHRARRAAPAIAVKSPKVGQHRIPQVSSTIPPLAPSVLTRVKIVRGLLSDCRRDSAAARDSGSWQAVNAFARLERQLWLDLDEATRADAQATADAEQAKLSARPDAELVGSIIAALRGMPPDAREQIMDALAGPASLRLVKAGG